MRPHLPDLSGSPDGSHDPGHTINHLRTLAALTADIADALARATDLRSGLHQCAGLMVQHLDAALARVWSLNEREQLLELQASAGLCTRLDGGHASIPVGRFHVGHVAQHRRPQFSNDGLTGPPGLDHDWARREGLRGFAAYPLIVGDRLVGVLALFSRQPLTAAVLHALATAADILAQGMDRGRAFDALRESEIRFSLAIRGIDEGIWDWNPATGETFLSPQVKILLGYQEHELGGSYDQLEALVHPRDRRRVIVALQRHLRRQGPFRAEYRLRTKAGDYRWFLARGQAVWDAGGRPVRMLGAIGDITPRKLAEQRQKALHRATRVLAETIDPDLALPRILHELCTSLDWDVGEYWARHRQADELRLAASCHAPGVAATNLSAATHGLAFRKGAGLPGRVWASGRPESVEDLTADGHFLRARAAAQDGLHGAVAVPVAFRGELHGVLQFLKADTHRHDPDALDALADIADHISRALDLRDNQLAVSRHQYELAIARRIQERLYPTAMPRLPGFAIAGASRPASATGGDYHDFIPLPGGQLLFAVGDVCGHGLGPALLMATARAYLRILAATGLGLGPILHHINIRLLEDTEYQFMTLLLGRLDPAQRTVSYCNAGHCRGLIHGPDGQVRASLEPSNLPLGVERDEDYKVRTLGPLHPGELLLLVSDGIPEAWGSAGAFGMPHALDAVRAARDLPPGDIVRTLLDTATAYTGGAPDDDMTAIAIKVTDPE